MSLKQTQIVILLGVFLLQYIFEHIYPQQKKHVSKNNNVVMEVAHFLEHRMY